MAKSEVITRTVTMTGDVVRTRIIVDVMLPGTLARAASTTLKLMSAIRAECRILQVPIIELIRTRFDNHTIGNYLAN